MVVIGWKTLVAAALVGAAAWEAGRRYERPRDCSFSYRTQRFTDLDAARTRIGA